MHPAKTGRSPWGELGAYSAIGLGNRVIHCQLFLTLNVALDMTQAQSNALACCASAWFSFYANALFTFKRFITTSGFLAFMVCIGGLSYAIGSAGDRLALP